MPIFITVSRILPEREQRNRPYRESDDPVTEAAEELSKETIINVEALKSFYQRRGGRPGTRINFMDGSGYAIRQAPDWLSGVVEALPVGPHATSAPTDAVATAERATGGYEDNEGETH